MILPIFLAHAHHIIPPYLHELRTAVRIARDTDLLSIIRACRRRGLAAPINRTQGNAEMAGGKAKEILFLAIFFPWPAIPRKCSPVLSDRLNWLSLLVGRFAGSVTARTEISLGLHCVCTTRQH